MFPSLPNRERTAAHSKSDSLLYMTVQTSTSTENTETITMYKTCTTVN